MAQDGVKLAIVGMGAIGGYVGGMLVKAGVDVTFIDQWQEHVRESRTAPR
jgi:2-dehydropantoate 2-reductase